jgi:hypothetical protein
MGPSSTGRFNNVYADTEYYKRSMDNPTFTGNWIKQLQQIAREFPKTNFVRVMGDTTTHISELVSDNLSNLPMSAFIDVINKA